MKTTIMLLALALSQPANAETGITEQLGKEIGKIVGGFSRELVHQSVKGTALEDKRKPIPLKKSLRECTKTPNVINEEVIKCMKGDED